MTRADYVIEGWKRMYIEGHWSLVKFEHHVEAMLPVIPLEWFFESQHHNCSQESPNT